MLWKFEQYDTDNNTREKHYFWQEDGGEEEEISTEKERK